MKLRLKYVFVLLVIAILLLPAKITAQNVTGSWIGWMSQDVGGAFPKYYFAMDMVQNEDVVTGTTYDYVKLGPIEHHCTFTFSGSFDNPVMKFHELDEVETYTVGIPEPRGCKISANLVFTSGDTADFLRGSWTGVANHDSTYICPPGKIFLTRTKEAVVVDTVIMLPEILDGRKVVYDKSYLVFNDEIKIALWDNNILDDDIISLNLNGDWIIQNYHLTHSHKMITVSIKPNTQNVLVLYAINEGKIPPNTAAIRIYDGKRTKMFTLCSNHESSGALTIVHQTN